MINKTTIKEEEAEVIPKWMISKIIIKEEEAEAGETNIIKLRKDIFKEVQEEVNKAMSNHFKKEEIEEMSNFNEEEEVVCS